jgi:hypothetical protein
MKTGSAALVGLVLATTVLSTTACGPMACPQALLSGQLVQLDDSLAVKTADFKLERVDWSNYSLRREGDDIVVTDFWGTALAREGNFVNLGGGQGPGNGPFKVCGQVDVVGS